MKSKNLINEAELFARLNINKWKVAISAFHHIAALINQANAQSFSDTPEEVSKALTVLSGHLHRRLTDGWDRLAILAPANPKLAKMLEDRTRTLFTEQNVQIMDMLGNYGSFYTADKEAFQKQVLEALHYDLPIRKPAKAKPGGGKKVKAASNDASRSRHSRQHP